MKTLIRHDNFSCRTVKGLTNGETISSTGWRESRIIGSDSPRSTRGSSAVSVMSDNERERPLMHLARLVSRIGHPLVSITISAGIVLTTKLPAKAAVLVLAALFLSVIAPITFLLLVKAQSGRPQDANVSEREERRSFYPWAIPFSALGAFLMWWLRAPIFVLRGGFVMLALFVVVAVANFWIKISLHTLFASYCAVILFRVGLGWGVGAAIMAAFVFRSRLFLSRHTLIETVAGVGLGVGGGLLAVW
jgi:hypothetical protein